MTAESYSEAGTSLLVLETTESVKVCHSVVFTAPSFPDKMSPIKALTMKDYENVSDLCQRVLDHHI